MIYSNPKVKDHWIVCFMLIKLVNATKVELEIWRSDFHIMEVVDYIKIMAFWIDCDEDN